MQQPAPILDQNELVFALDIGTRSIIGVVGVARDDLFEVLALERQEHTRRAMIDGQIEDIEQTAKVASQVRETLEERLGRRFHHVCVAAAGRALRTHRAEATIELSDGESIDIRRVAELEMKAIDAARETVDQSGEGRFYCVGHSVVRYHLDDYPISTLIGHRGRRARADVIATFLPMEVVESLYTTMRRLGLTVSSLTLEPIAAMNAIIPEELRLLNLALVDIGAGTSDIALSNEGSVMAYTMATVAGDELSEAIIKNYLVDFETAEAVKLSLSAEGDMVEFENILGFSQSLPKRDILERISPALESLCEEICSRILEANGQSPAAVFLVGGGSRFPGLCERVAQRLSLEPNKVAVGGNNYMKRLVSTSRDSISGPDLATPLGIAITAAADRAREGFSVLLNGERLQLFKNNAVTVMDVLLMAGYRQSQIIGRAGRSVTFELNGQKTVVRGGHPTAAAIALNGSPASLSTPVTRDAELTLEEAVSGADAHPVVQDVDPDWSSFEVTMDGAPCQAGSRAYLNDQPVGPQQPLDNLDSLVLVRVDTPEALCREAGLDAGDRCFVINGVAASPDARLSPGDEVRLCSPEELERLERQPAAPELSLPEPPPEPEPEPPIPTSPALNIRINGEERRLPPKTDGTPYLFVDTLNYIDIDPTKPEGDIVLRLNGAPASYVAPLADGDDVDIHWDSR